MRETDYVVVEWMPNLPQYPRYSVATARHAEELGANVQSRHTCASLELAAQIANELNAREINGNAQGGHAHV